MLKHTVRDGDCILSLAEEHGLFWQTVWDHPENAQLKRERKSPNIIYPGDQVFIPERRRKEIGAATEKCHRFEKKGTPAKLHLRFLRCPPSDKGESGSQSQQETVSESSETVVEVQIPPRPQHERREEPRAEVPYILNLDGRLSNGTTDSEGRVEISIPPTARQGTLTLEPGSAQATVIPLKLGCLDPVSELRGVKERLANLGFECGDRSEEETAEFRAALATFQEAHGLDPTGRIDDATRDSLEGVHGS